LAITWLFVMTYPSALTMTPDPRPESWNVASPRSITRPKMSRRTGVIRFRLWMNTTLGSIAVAAALNARDRLTACARLSASAASDSCPSEKPGTRFSETKPISSVFVIFIAINPRLGAPIAR